MLYARFIKDQDVAMHTTSPDTQSTLYPLLSSGIEISMLDTTRTQYSFKARWLICLHTSGCMDRRIRSKRGRVLSETGSVRIGTQNKMLMFVRGHRMHPLTN
jgi:hypothetical protein